MASPRRPWVFWLVVVLLLPVLIYLSIVTSIALAISANLTVPLKGPVCCLGLAHEDVHFQTADGVALAGWYVPPKNGTIIILLHSYFMDRRQTQPVAEMLVRHGYGVLMYDQRASGESAGDVRSLGWRDIPDVDQAIAFVQSQPGVDKSRIGVYGCSMGGAIALAAAARNSSIAAVAADAPSYLTFDEARPRVGDPNWMMDLPLTALYHSFVALRAGTLPPTSTLQAVRSLAPRPLLLISSGQPSEQSRVDAFYDGASGLKIRWHIPNAGHCGGPSTQPDEYEQHLIDFFDGMLK